MKLPTKFKQRYEKLGLVGALKLTWAKATVGRKRKIILGLKDPEKRFTKIYLENHWNDSESRSGEGSTLENTQNVRNELPKILKKYNIKSMLDAPCGDFNWMKLVTQDISIKYIGGDIVKPMIENNQAKYGDNNISFAHLDITKNLLPEVDLMFCRDCLFHLSYQDIAFVLENFLNSKIPYLVTTSHAAPNGPRIENSNIITGDMRLLDLFSKPFSLTSDCVLENISDHMASLTAKRSLILINRAAVQKMFENLKVVQIPNPRN
jgi:SAM-dependent methyltransferase